jgi:ABC-type transporter Mla MlaB component
VARKKSAATRLTLDGVLTMRTTEATHAKLLAAADRQAVEIDCSGATEVDASFIQLVLAARASARQQQRVLTLAQPADGPLRQALQRGGFLVASADQAFWLQPTRA